MRKVLIFLAAIIWSFFAPAQMNNGSVADTRLTPLVNTITHRLGDDEISIKTLQYGDTKDIVFISLHDNEATSVDGSKRILESRGGLLIQIGNNSKRNITFRLDGRSYTFDPNRIFSRNGIELTLKRFDNTGDKAATEIEVFADRLLQLIPKNSFCVIALHNNTNNDFSVQDYLPGKEKATDASQINIGTGKDADDFFLTTDSLLFQLLSAQDYNIILQDNQKATQDGSLSVYFGEKNIRYINCETEHGKLKQYEEMLGVAVQCLEEIKKLATSSQ